MGEVISLNKARKVRDKVVAKAGAAANRIAHGLTRVEKDAARKEREAAERRIDAHRIDD